MMRFAIVVLYMTTLTAFGGVTKAPFGNLPDGRQVDIYTITDVALEVRIMTYGARIVSIRTPDRNGKIENVVLGYDKLDGYLEDKSTYFGAVVGRYGNRIAHGQFSIEGHKYQVSTNNNGNSLHGGVAGFDQLVWHAQILENGLEMTLTSEDGDQGFPGTLQVRVRYTVNGGALKIEYMATTDKPTVVNLTNHSYFNLSGDKNKTILEEFLLLPADTYTPVNSNLIPTGELASVTGTPFDFRRPTLIGARIDGQNDQLKIAGGYDQNWVLAGTNGELKMAAQVTDAGTGRRLSVTTTEPGIQFYSGNFLNGKEFGPDHQGHAKRTGLCLETQHYPDSPNHSTFPTTLLMPNEVRESTTIFTFTTESERPAGNRGE